MSASNGVILALKTGDDDCWLWLIDNHQTHEFKWTAGRELARGLLKFLKQSLGSLNYDWDDVSGIVVFRGPGSYTGLRIGITVANSLADSLKVPIVGQDGLTWLEEGQKRLASGQDDQLVKPIYVRSPKITKPRK